MPRKAHGALVVVAFLCSRILGKRFHVSLDCRPENLCKTFWSGFVKGGRDPGHSEGDNKEERAALTLKD